MTPSPHQIKALFYQLVKASGGCDAAGEVLGVSRQRVSQLQTLVHADMPTILQVAALEQFTGQAIVTGALAKLVESQGRANNLLQETSEAIEAGAAVLTAVVSGADHREISRAVVKAHKELDDVSAALVAHNAA